MKILVVDDEELNVEIIDGYLEEEGYEVIKAVNGADAYSKLTATPGISLILLDRNMPIMDGIEFLKKMKADEKYNQIPVVLQTAVADNDSVAEGISAGAYYYLTKPYKKNVLLSIVQSALSDARYKSEIVDEVRKHRFMLGYLNNADFELKTMHEAQTLAYFIAGCFPEPEKVVLGLSEILFNAIEHGNLGITYKEKGALMHAGRLQEEILHRESLAENKDKKIKLTFKRTSKEIKVTVKDQGNGFNWQEFIEMTPQRATDPNGRGIIMARTFSFDAVEYNENGNEVSCYIYL